MTRSSVSAAVLRQWRVLCLMSDGVPRPIAEVASMLKTNKSRVADDIASLEAVGFKIGRVKDMDHSQRLLVWFEPQNPIPKPPVIPA